ncbi:AIG2-like protein D [Camellia lanceoleosa]|uniref:AIG2-like protein D n=1 Tax=Camellia lanceoleosa TaxID=1840588 RepID=A0ACC0IYR4_9ERIC|nr:AIG2-like protein D [Camellia lanceoleosa]
MDKENKRNGSSSSVFCIFIPVRTLIGDLHMISHRFSVKECVYPAIILVKNKKVTRKVSLGITLPELDIFNTFEDVEYNRCTVEVSLMVCHPLNFYIEDEFHRASRGRAGGVKSITNYASVLVAEYMVMIIITAPALPKSSSLSPSFSLSMEVKALLDSRWWGNISSRYH